VVKQDLGARRNRRAGGIDVIDKTDHTRNRHSRPNPEGTVEISPSLLTAQGGLRRGIADANEEVPTNTRIFIGEKGVGENSRLVQTALPMTVEMKGHRYDDSTIGKLVKLTLREEFTDGRQHRSVAMIFESS
jgi:hypothetical protein